MRWITSTSSAPPQRPNKTAAGTHRRQEGELNEQVAQILRMDALGQAASVGMVHYLGYPAGGSGIIPSCASSAMAAMINDAMDIAVFIAYLLDSIHFSRRAAF